jgi:Ca2+-transporting ATPase
MVTLNGVKNISAILKGAPEVVINKCDNSFLVSSLDKQLIHAEIEKMGNRGMRVLAVAQKQWSESEKSELEADDIKGGFSFIGLIGMIDPPRAEAIEAIKACRNAGIEVKMITGDHPTTALAIGIELGLTTEKRVVSGVELSKMDDTELEEIVKSVNIFARVDETGKSLTKKGSYCCHDR